MFWVSGFIFYRNPFSLCLIAADLSLVYTNSETYEWEIQMVLMGWLWNGFGFSLAKYFPVCETGYIFARVHICSRVYFFLYLQFVSTNSQTNTAWTEVQMYCCCGCIGCSNAFFYVHYLLLLWLLLFCSVIWVERVYGSKLCNIWFMYKWCECVFVCRWGIHESLFHSL